VPNRGPPGTIDRASGAGYGMHEMLKHWSASPLLLA
jgi:hypothetical protein